MHLRLILAAALAAGLSSAAQAQQQWPGVTLYDNKGAAIGTAANPINVTGGTGGGGSGSTGSVTAAGTNGTSAQAVQGITGGVPVAVSGTVAATQSGTWSVGLTGTLPAFASTPTFNVGITNGLALDATIIARLGTLGQKNSAGSSPVVIASDQSAIPVSGTVTANLGTLNGAATAANQNVTAAGTSATNAQAVQGVTGGVPQNVANGGAFAVQNTAAVVGGNATAVKTDGSATTQPVSATALPLPAGASTAANQTSEITALNTIAGRIQTFTDFNNTAAGQNADNLGPVRTVGTGYTRYNAVFSTSQSGTASILGCATSDCSTGPFYILASSNVTSTAAVAINVPIPTPYVRVRYTNGTTAGAFNINSALTAN